MKYLVSVKFPVGTDVKETAGGVIGTSAKGVPVGEELNGVDIGFMAGESLDGLAGTDIPKLSKSIASARDEDVLVGRVDADGHDITQVVREFGDLGARFNIPQHTGHVTGGSENAAVVDEAAAGEVAGVTGELARDAGGTFARGQVVDGANVIQTTAGNVVPTGGVGAGHDP